MPSNGSSRGSAYIEANFNCDLIEKVCFPYFDPGKLTLILHLGHQTIRHYTYMDYTDWRVTLIQEFPWFSVFVSYVGTNANHDFYDIPDNAYHPHKVGIGAQGFIFGMNKSF